ncbi:MAG: hypothetical protein HY763_14740 [Planctomycetes bacterium]|nr:hypothetical protein [Planctomycetota bacterium]
MGSAQSGKAVGFPAVMAAGLVLALADNGGAARVVERDQSVLSFESPLGQTAQLAVDGDGVQTVTVRNADGGVAARLAVAPGWASRGIDLTVDDFGDFELALSAAEPPAATINLEALPEAAQVSVSGGGTGAPAISVAVSDPNGERVGAALAITTIEDASGISIVYDVLPEDLAAAEAADDEGGTGRVTPLFPGLAEEHALGGSVTLAASGVAVDGVMVVSLAYNPDDVSADDEPALRLHRFSNAAGAYQPVGSNDRGVGAATVTPGDYGVDTTAHAAWAVVDQLGSFAVGIPDSTLPSTIDGGDDDAVATPTALVPRGRLCGVPGVLGFAATFLSLLALRRVP